MKGISLTINLPLQHRPDGRNAATCVGCNQTEHTKLEEHQADEVIQDSAIWTAIDRERGDGWCAACHQRYSDPTNYEGNITNVRICIMEPREQIVWVILAEPAHDL